MSIQHHGMSPKELAAQHRLMDELFGRAKLRWPNGQIDPEDAGETALAMAVDPAHKIIRIHFTKPITWIGLDKPSAEHLRNLLDEKIKEL